MLHKKDGNVAKLVFVYNAEAGLMSGMMDSLHKTLSPDTYECALCAVTHGFFTMDKTWRAYLKALPLDAVFFHRKDFALAHPDVKVTLPVIMLERDSGITPLLSADDLKQATDVDALAKALDQALSREGVI